jgi:hypothetical protein
MPRCGETEYSPYVHEKSMCNDFAPEGTTRVVEARPVLYNCVVGQSVELTVAVGVAADPDAVHPASANPPTAKIPSTFSPRRVS